MNKLKQERRGREILSKTLVETNLVSNGTRLTNSGIDYIGRFLSCPLYPHVQKTDYIARKVTQKLKNLKWFFWKLEQKNTNTNVLNCGRLLLRQARKEKVILP